MKTKISDHIIHKPNWLKIFIIITLVLGIFFRFVNLDGKFYNGGDEPYTSWRISGHSLHKPLEINSSLGGNLFSVEDLLRYQYPDPETNLWNTVTAEVTHPPLYFLMTRIWVEWFGNSIAVTRSFSAFISLLTFPLIYWLCKELFDFALVGWMGIALVAVSPFHVVYSQHARMYSLWTVITVLCSVYLLRAIRLKTKLSWGFYSATLILGIYSHFFLALTAIGHGIYVFVNEGFRFTKTVIAYVVASFIALLAFLPWLWFIYTNSSNFEKSVSWSTVSMPLSSLIQSWIYHVTYGFIDFFYVFSLYPDLPFNWKFGRIIVPLILILVIFSIYFLFRNTPKRIWLFVFTLIGVTATAVIFRDLMSGGYISTKARYFVPCYIGIQLAVAYLLAKKITSINNQEQKLWKIITVMLISGGVLSCAIRFPAETWWNKGSSSYDEYQAVKIINQANNPLLITTTPPLGISHELDPKVQIMVVKLLNIPKIPKQFDNIFIRNPSKALKNELETQQNYKLNVVYKGKKRSLYTLSPNR
jgi:uncharacterized membrane protein